MGLSNEPVPAALALADGSVFYGLSAGARKTVVAEVVFNTSMTGYQEILSDPSYRGQLVCLTAPEIGNVGVNPDDDESPRFGAAGLIARRLSPVVSSWRAEGELGRWLEDRGMPALIDVDTRRLTRTIRERGAMMGALSTELFDVARLVELAKAAPGMDGAGLAREVGLGWPEPWTRGEWRAQAPAATGARVVVWDFGVKHQILKILAQHGLDVRVVPASTGAAEILALEPDGVLLSNGPGDPAALPEIVEQARRLLAAEPGPAIAGICLGHQLLGLALGADTFKLGFGHHGGNHPVRDVATGRVWITAQNHGFAVGAGPALRATHEHLFDQTLAGLTDEGRRIRAVQFHPEASPGPHDARPWLADFAAECVARARRRAAGREGLARPSP